MREHAAEQAPTVEAPVRPSAPVLAGVLALQSAVGNGAVSRMLARDPVTVSEYVKEETTGADNVTWTASFDVEFDKDTATCWLTMKVHLTPDGVSKDDLSQLKIGLLSKFTLLWDSKFTLHQTNVVWDDDWLLRPRIQFVDDPKQAHLRVTVHKGRGADNRQNWYVGSPSVTHAHEASHQMGLLDEYEDATVKNRKVYDDHSIMGDYYKEGAAEATAKPRHGERLAKIISRATGRKLTSRKTG